MFCPLALLMSYVIFNKILSYLIHIDTTSSACGVFKQLSPIIIIIILLFQLRAPEEAESCI